MSAAAADQSCSGAKETPDGLGPRRVPRRHGAPRRRRGGGASIRFEPPCVVRECVDGPSVVRGRPVRWADPVVRGLSPGVGRGRSTRPARGSLLEEGAPSPRPGPAFRSAPGRAPARGGRPRRAAARRRRERRPSRRAPPPAGSAAISAARSSAAVERLLGRHDLRDETQASGLLGANLPAGQDELHGPGGADRARQPLRAAGTGNDPELDLGLPEDGVAPGDEHVAGHRELATAPQRVPPHGSDRGRRRRRRPDPSPGTPPLPRATSGVCSASSAMSAPAAKARLPAPVITIARTAGSASSASTTRARSVSSAKLRALSARGR